MKTEMLTIGDIIHGNDSLVFTLFENYFQYTKIKG